MRNFFSDLYNPPRSRPRIETSRLGVSIIPNDTKAINTEWREIERIDATKVDLVTEDEVIFELFLKNQTVIVVSESLDDFDQFVDYLENTWPKIPKDWRRDIVHPPFAKNRVTVFKV